MKYLQNQCKFRAAKLKLLIIIDFNLISTGSRDEVIKEVLQHLLTFDSFEQFATMMNREYNIYREKQGHNDLSNDNKSKVADNNNGWKELIDPVSKSPFYWNEFTGETTWDPPSKFEAVQTPKPEGFSEVYTALLNMGFPPESIVVAMNEAQGVFSYDDLVAKLSGSQGHGSTTDDHVDNADYNGSTNQAMTDYFIQFAKELTNREESEEWLNNAAIDLSDKINTASSVLTTFDQDNNSDHEVKLMSWAKDMKQLHEDLIYAFNKSIPFKLMTEHYEAGLIAWYEDLEMMRATIDENSVISEDELRRIEDLNKIAGKIYIFDCIHNRLNAV